MIHNCVFSIVRAVLPTAGYIFLLGTAFALGGLILATGGGAAFLALGGAMIAQAIGTALGASLAATAFGTLLGCLVQCISARS